MKKILTCLIIVFTCIFIFSITMIFRYFNNNRIDTETFEELYELATENEIIPSHDAVEKPLEIIEENEKTASVNLDALQEINPDCAAWISIDGTAINYPVMFTPDSPNKYLRKNFYGDDSRSGTPFIQDGSALECDNVIIHAHNMLSGTMFAGLKKYLDKSFFMSHPSIVLQTNTETVTYTVIALAQVKDDDIWYSYAFENNENDFEYLTSSLLAESVYTSDIKPELGDKFITLSTCYGKKDDDRLILVGIHKKPA